MLIRITNHCRMGCNHCMNNADENNQHMEMATFAKALEFTKHCDLPYIAITGGEPLEHPDFFEIANMAKESQMLVSILSNGMFVEDHDLTQKVLDLGISVQITNDPRFYPQKVPRLDHELLLYERTIRMLTLMGRALENKEIMENSGLPMKTAPQCFNLRSCARKSRSFQESVMKLRTFHKFCTPSINVDGSIVAGESTQCCRIGTIWSEDCRLLDSLRNMRCNNCGLEDNLSSVHLNAIGL